jgi:hypothetical protein
VQPVQSQCASCVFLDFVDFVSAEVSIFASAHVLPYPLVIQLLNSFGDMAAKT